jgi:hypothetical protein
MQTIDGMLHLPMPTPWQRALADPREALLLKPGSLSVRWRPPNGSPCFCLSKIDGYAGLPQNSIHLVHRQAATSNAGVVFERPEKDDLSERLAVNHVQAFSEIFTVAVQSWKQPPCWHHCSLHHPCRFRQTKGKGSATRQGIERSWSEGAL